MNGQQPPLSGGAQDNFVDLAAVQKHAVELLAQLDRLPRSLRIRAGTVAVDITWADNGAPADVDTDPQARAVTAAPVAAAAPPASVRAAAQAGAGADDVAGESLRSPGVGVFYHSREPGAEPFVSVGSQVQPGQQIGIIEAMKLMIPVEADRAGRVVEVLKANGEPVEYDEPLFALETVDA